MGARTGATASTVTLCLIQFVDVLGVTVVVAALPAMLDDTGSGSPTDGALISTGYATLFGGLLVFGSRVGDRYGHRRTILVGLALFALGALLTAIAPTAMVVTVGRCLQGAAAAVAVPSALALLTTIAPDERARARALAAWSAAGAVAGASGFLVGGVVTQLAGWRVIFWLMLAVALVQAVALVTIVRRVHVDTDGTARPSLAPLASALLTAAVMLLVVGATLLGEAAHRFTGAVLLVAAVVCALGFVQADRRSRSPLLPADLVRRPVLRRGAAGAFLNTATTSAVATVATLYLQDALGWSPLTTALTLLPLSVMVVVGALLAAPLVVRLARERVAALGLVLIAIGTAALLVRPDGGPVPAVGMAVGMGVAGVGLGVASVATTSLGTDVEPRRRATASGIVNTTPQLGTAVGTAALLLVVTATTGLPGAGSPAPVVAWGAAVALAAAGAVGFLVLRPARPAQDLHRTTPDPDRGRS